MTDSWPGRFDRRGALLAGLILTSALATTPAQAQPVQPAQNAPADKLDALKARDQELQALRDAQKKSAESESALKREIEALGAERRKLNTELIEGASRVRQLEARIAATEARLKPLDDRRAALRKSLDGRRAVIAEILAALQRMGRHPPPALLVSPEDALQAVRTAMLLGAVVPEIRQQAQALAHDLGELVKVRKDIAAERDGLQTEIASIGRERERLTALSAERQRAQTERESSLAGERARAAELAKQADSLKDLIAKLEQGVDAATRAAREAARPEGRPGMAALHDPGRLAPGIAFASLRGRIPIPVNGVKIREFGAPDGAGSTEKGLSVATRAAAQVTAPADGWVVYAGPFRSYGQLLILNAGGGYHILLAGMERISVDLGQFVLTGEPVAAMGNSSHIAAVLATGSAQPVLYVEFRKDGIPIDPGPWWASEVEKVRG